MRYAAALSSVLCCLAIPVSAQIVHVWDLADTASDGPVHSVQPRRQRCRIRHSYYRRRY